METDFPVAPWKFTGTMGTVVLAARPVETVETRRESMYELLNPLPIHDPGYNNRIKREIAPAKSLSRIHHPCIWF